MQYHLGFHEARPRGRELPTDLRVGDAACLSGECDRIFRWCAGCSAVDKSRDALLDELLKVHEYERQRMGQELHDSAGQLLVALQLSIAHLREIEKGAGHEDLLDEVQDTIRQIDRQIRSLAFLHYPAELDERGVRFALEKLVRGFDRRTGISSTFKTVGEVEDLGPAVSEALLRVAQEALVNVHRHAHASSVKMQLLRLNGQVRLSVSDDGVGLPSTGSDTLMRGVGLQSMAHRVHGVDGELQLRDLKPGLKLVATIPVN